MLGFFPIMIATIIFNTVYAQMSTVFVEQVRAPHTQRAHMGLGKPIRRATSMCVVWAILQSF